MMQGTTGTRPGRRMVSLGRVTAPKPVNLPSQKRENNGLDPNVTIVPKSSSVWGNPDNGQGDAAALPQPQAPVQPPQPSPPAQFGSAWGGAAMAEKRQVSALLKQEEFPTLGANPSDGTPNGVPYNGGHGYGFPPQAPPPERSPWDAPPPAPYGKPGAPVPGNFQPWGGPAERWGGGPPPAPGPGGYGPPPPGQYQMERPPYGPRYMPHPAPGFMDYPPPPPPPPPRARPSPRDIDTEAPRDPPPNAPVQNFSQPPSYASDRNAAGSGYLPPHLRNRDRRDGEDHVEQHLETSTPSQIPDAPAQQAGEWGVPPDTQPSQAAGMHASLPQPSPPKILRREPASPPAAPEPRVQPQAPPPQSPHLYAAHTNVRPAQPPPHQPLPQHQQPPQQGPQQLQPPQYQQPPQQQQQQQQPPQQHQPPPQQQQPPPQQQRQQQQASYPHRVVRGGPQQQSPPDQPRMLGQGPLQFGQLESPSGQAKQILGQHLQGSFEQQQPALNGPHPLHNHPIQQQRPHSGQGFSPKVQQQLGFSPAPTAAEPAPQGPLMTFGQLGQGGLPGQGGPSGRVHETSMVEHRDAARELEAQQAFMRQKALQRHQEAMAHQQQQERIRRDSEASRLSLPQSTHSQHSQQESDRDAGHNGGGRGRSTGAVRGRGREGGRGRGAREDRMGGEGLFGTHPAPQTAIPPSEQLIMQAKMRALTLEANQTSNHAPQQPQQQQQQQQQQQRRPPPPARPAAQQREAPRAEPIREAQPKAVPVQRLPREDSFGGRQGGPSVVPVTAHDRPDRVHAVPAEPLPQRERPRREKRGRLAEPADVGHGTAVAVAVSVEHGRHGIADRGDGEQHGKQAAEHREERDAPHGGGGSRGPRQERRPRPPRGDKHSQQEGGTEQHQQSAGPNRRASAAHGDHRLENGDLHEEHPRGDHGPHAPRREAGRRAEARGMNDVHEEAPHGESKRPNRGERGAKKARAVGSEEGPGMGAPPGLDAAPGGGNAAAKKAERAERELYHPPVKEPADSGLVEIGEHSGQMTNGKPPGLRARRPRGGRDRRPARDKAAEESTDGTGDGQEGADGGGEHGQEHKTRAPRSRGRGRGQEGKGNKMNGDTATPEAASETTSNKVDDGEGGGEGGEGGQGKGPRSSRSGRGRGSRGGSGRGRRAKDGDGGAAAPTVAVPITVPANSGTDRGTERPSSGSGPSAGEEGGKPRTIQVARGVVDAKGKRVWTVKDGGPSNASGKAEGGSTAPAAVAASSGAAE